MLKNPTDESIHDIARLQEVCKSTAGSRNQRTAINCCPFLPRNENSGKFWF